MAFYTGERFARWRGDVLMGALRGQGVLRVRLAGERAVEEELMLAGQVGRVRDVRVGPDGLVYLLTDLPNGQLLRIEPAQ
jgi:glucose/arabinose dehydrogenase